MKSYTFRIIIEPDEKKTFHGYVPSLPGCHTWGKTVQETRENLDDAIRAYVASLVADNQPVPLEVGLDSFTTVSASELSLGVK